MPRVVVAGVLSLASSFAQTPAVPDAPEFEVASIRPSNPEEWRSPSGCETGNGLMRCTNVTLKRCITGSYAVGAERVLGGPAWIDTDRFQITAKATDPVGDKQLMAMLVTLLAERFKLELHRESRPGEAMILEVSGKGHKLQPAGDAHSSYRNLHDHFDATAITMTQYAEVLSRDLHLPVLNRTGLQGAFNFSLRWKPDDSATRDEALALLRLEMSAQIARQLGLTLKTKKMPIEFLVVDHAERPSPEN